MFEFSRIIFVFVDSAYLAPRPVLGGSGGSCPPQVDLLGGYLFSLGRIDQHSS